MSIFRAFSVLKNATCEFLAVINHEIKSFQNAVLVDLFVDLVDFAKSFSDSSILSFP